MKDSELQALKDGYFYASISDDGKYGVVRSLDKIVITSSQYIRDRIKQHCTGDVDGAGDSMRALVDKKGATIH